MKTRKCPQCGSLHMEVGMFAWHCVNESCQAVVWEPEVVDLIPLGDELPSVYVDETGG